MNTRFHKAFVDLMNRHGMVAGFVIVNDGDTGTVLTGGEMALILDTFRQAVGEHLAIEALCHTALKEGRAWRKERRQVREHYQEQVELVFGALVSSN